MKVKKILLGLIILFCVAGIGYYIYRDLVRHSVSNIMSEPTPGVGESENVHDSVLHIFAHFGQAHFA